MVEWVEQVGWPKQRVVVIDEDQGTSGAVAKSRSGFEQLVTSVGRGGDRREPRGFPFGQEQS
jgi:hypothetical protein